MPKIVDKEEMRHRIRHGALAAFAEEGYHGTTMESVARRTGIAKGTLYLYFKSKEAMAVHIVEAHLTTLAEVHMPEQPFADLEHLHQALYRLVDIHDEHAGFIPVFFESFGPSFGNSELATRMADFYDRFGRYYARQIVDLQDRGMISVAVNATTFGRALVSMMDGMVLHRGLFGISASRQKRLAREAIKLLIAGLRNR